MLLSCVFYYWNDYLIGSSKYLMASLVFVDRLNNNVNKV